MGHAHAFEAARAQSLTGVAKLDIFGQSEAFGLSDIHFKADPVTGLRAIIAIHSTRLGPAIGGCRCVSYASQANAVVDTMRLAQAMSYKAAINDLPCGGGKAVLMRPEQIHDRAAFFEAFGDFVEQLGGRYIAAVDSGTTVEDMDPVARRTRHVGCTSTETGGTGDPSPWTALGVRRGIEAAVHVALGRKDLRGLHVMIQRAGHVGYRLAQELHGHGAHLTVSDIDPDAAKRCAEEFGARITAPENVYDAVCDVFAPCALGGVINPLTVERLNTRVLAGSANNPLDGDPTADALHRRGILYAPDYVINAGGLISLVLRDADRVRKRILHIHAQLMAIFEQSHRSTNAPSWVANAMAEQRLYGSQRVG